MLIKLYENKNVKIELREKIINEKFHEYTIRLTGKNIKEENLKYYNRGEAIEKYYKLVERYEKEYEILGEIKYLTPEKKILLKSLEGSATSPIDFNELRDYYKYGESILVREPNLRAMLKEFDLYITNYIKNEKNLHMYVLCQDIEFAWIDIALKYKSTYEPAPYFDGTKLGLYDPVEKILFYIRDVGPATVPTLSDYEMEFDEEYQFIIKF